jgi:ComF family protein
MGNSWDGEMFSRYFTRIFKKVMGTVCIGCERVHGGETLWCSECAAALPWWSAARACLRCAEPLAATDEEGAICERCLVEPPPFASAAAAFWYRPPIDQWVLRLKFGYQLTYAAALGTAIAQQVGARGDLVIPIPLSAERQRQRGFNQAAEIARHLAGYWQLPWSRRALVRTKSTAMQARLSAVSRQQNVAHAFRVAERRLVAARHVVLIDDVMTTGATLAAAAHALLAAGAVRVDVVVAARASAVPANKG